ncbi:MAG: hypothetical protein OXN83_02795 [Oligoflexia bacterium]|nr:hypothetical protein [Oligoflexia bacterium]
MDVLVYYISNFIQEISPVMPIFIGLVAIWFAWKSRKILKEFKESFEVFFQKERMLQGYNHHIELFKPLIHNQKDIEKLKRDIITFQLDIKKIFSNESKYNIMVHNCDWDNIYKSNHFYRYTIKIIKEKQRKSMPEIYHPNKSKIGQYGFVVAILEGNNSKLLSIGSPYFIFFRLGGFREQPTSLSKPQGCWLITKTIDKNNTKYPFFFEGEYNKSFPLTADEFMQKRT